MTTFSCTHQTLSDIRSIVTQCDRHSSTFDRKKNTVKPPIPCLGSKMMLSIFRADDRNIKCQCSQKKKKLGLDDYTNDARQMNPVFPNGPKKLERCRRVAAGGR